jgi:cytochrome b561
LNNSISSPATTAGNGRTRYDSVAIALHWLTAALVVAQFALSQIWGFFDKPFRHVLIVTHMSFGVLLTMVILARIVWRLIPGHQVSPANTGWMAVASNAAHYSLYALLASEAVLGFLLGWAGKSGALSFFGLSIPSPLTPFSRESHHLIGEVHEWVGWTIIIITTGHAVAALFHHYVLRDGLLSRMAPSRG